MWGDGSRSLHVCALPQCHLARRRLGRGPGSQRGVLWCPCAADSAYPGTQPAFFSAFSEVTDRSTADNTDIEICTPLLHMDKTAIVYLGLQLQAPLHLTWSCYEHQDHPCQRCHSCLLRAQGVAAGGVLDPLMTENQT